MRILMMLLGAMLATSCTAPQNAPQPGAGRESGRICIARLPENAAEIDRDPVRKRTRRDYTYAFSVQPDGRDRITVRRDRGVLVQGLAPGQPHTLTIRDGEQDIETLSFTFEEKRSEHLCLSYTPWYQTWRLEPARREAWWCDCDQP